MNTWTDVDAGQRMNAQYECWTGHWTLEGYRTGHWTTDVGQGTGHETDDGQWVIHMDAQPLHCSA